MTSRECAIVSAYTGYLLGDGSELHRYAEEILGRTIFVTALGTPIIAKELMACSREDFLALGAPHKYKPKEPNKD